MNKLQRAYLAGLIDGEGYIGIVKVKKGNKKQWFSNREFIFHPILKVAMTDENIIRWLKDSYGGTFEVRKSHHNAKESYGWQLRKSQTRDFISKIYPYLRVKKRQAEIILRFPKHIAGYPIPDDVYHKRIELYDSMRILNKRGNVRD